MKPCRCAASRLLTMLRVFILIALASLIWVPIGVWVGMRPRATQIVQPIAQFMAAFPANLLFPIAVYGIVAWKLNPDIYLSPLMILGRSGTSCSTSSPGRRRFPRRCVTSRRIFG
jgi:NitT/TauT family transport system permease protein